MWIDQNGNLYDGDMRIGDRAATQEEIDAWVLARQPSEVELKKQAVLNATIAALSSGALNNMLWVSIESTIKELMQNPIVIAAEMDRDDVVAALTTTGSPYYNEDFSDTYRHFNMLNNLIKGESV